MALAGLLLVQWLNGQTKLSITNPANDRNLFSGVTGIRHLYVQVNRMSHIGSARPVGKEGRCQRLATLTKKIAHDNPAKGNATSNG